MLKATFSDRVGDACDSTLWYCSKRKVMKIAEERTRD
jgi:hypothetical protein